MIKISIKLKEKYVKAKLSILQLLLYDDTH